MDRRSVSGYLLSAPLVVLVAGLLILPIGTFLVYSFMESGLFKVEPNFTLENYAVAFSEPVYRQLMLNSLKIGVSTAVISTVLGYFMAYHISFRAGRSKTLLLALTVVSILGGYLVRIYAWRIILGVGGVFNTVLMQLGLTQEPIEFLLFSRFAVVVALVNIFIPFTAAIIYAALENVQRDQIEAARDLGATPMIAFWKVTLPLTGRAVFAGFLFVFLLTAADYITPQLIGGTSGSMIGVVVYDQFVRLGNWGLGAALSFCIVLVFTAVLAATWLAMRSAGILKGGA
jgi:spermidine/putrescine transport system permease protein